MSVVAVVGLGYVGLPLAIEFGKRMPTVGLDLLPERIESCRQQIDPSGNISREEFQTATQLEFSNDASCLALAEYVLVAVPTPIDGAKQPDLRPLINASQSVGEFMKRGVTVVFESTVYPGATEEVCIPLLEQASGMKWGLDFNVGYSPERINPGDKEHVLSNTVKIVSGDTTETRERIAILYETVVHAGVHRVSSIKVAEAAKVIENTQRDLNIALMNELAIILKLQAIDTLEVLQAASSKWNFLPFQPGLVGGHCIGVDPYYLTYKAETLGYHPEVILAGRRINDGMGKYIAEQTVKQMIKVGKQIYGAKAIVLGITFKENVPDTRNSKSVDLVSELKSYGLQVCVHDPLADFNEVRGEYGLELIPWDVLPQADAIVLAVPHAKFLARTYGEFAAKASKNCVFVDVKSRMDLPALINAGFAVWRL